MEFVGFVCLGLEHFLQGEVFGTRKQKGKGHNDAFPVFHNSVNSVNSVNFVKSLVDFLDRINRIFKISGVLGFVCLFLQYFLHGEVFGTRKQKGKGHNDAFPVSHNSVNSVNFVKSS